MKKGSSVMIFPEGTRSKTGELRRFMDGAFVLAKKMECGVIPVVHTGTEKAFRKGKNSWILQGRAKIRIRVLDEIPADMVRSMDVEALKDFTRKTMTEGLKKMQI
jgi:1-acyl-sn-glycerol-3-phosphate acyltransferase